MVTWGQRQDSDMGGRRDRIEKRVKASEEASGKSADIHGATVEAISGLTSRIAALELVVKANARTTERGFANVQEQITSLDSKFTAEIASLRRDLPGMLVDAIRESRG